jgi:hypothetical protein
MELLRIKALEHRHHLAIASDGALSDALDETSP